MKPIYYFLLVFISFSILGCKKCQNKEQIENSYIIIKFDDNLILPKNLIGEDSLNYAEYIHQQKLYENLQISNDNDFRLQEPEDKFRELLMTSLNQIFNEQVTIKPLFNRRDISNFYNKLLQPRQDSTIQISCPNTISTSKLPPNLSQFYVVPKCVSEIDARTFVAAINKLGFQLTARFNDFQNPKRKKQMDDNAIQAIGRKETFFDFRKAMNIDLLNQSINGDSSNIVILEYAEEVDFTHQEFKDIQQRFGNRIEKLGTGGDLTHATNTFGLIFANPSQTNGKSLNAKYANACKGIASKTNLKKVINYGNSYCDTVPDIYNALLKAINSTKKGDILLLELVEGGLPLEYNPICHDLIQAATNLLSVVIIEPIGNNGVNLDSVSNLVGGAVKPATFEAILVGATNENREPIANKSQNITCFAYGDKLLTTHNNPKNSYSLFGETSGASAIIAGLACNMQGYCKQSTGCYLSPQEMKNLFRKTKKTNSNSVNGFKQHVIPDALQLISEVDSLINHVRP